MVFDVGLGECALDLDALECLEPSKAPETFPTQAQLVLGIGLVERIDIEVVEADAIINDGERSDGRGLIWKKGRFPFDDNADFARPLLPLRIPDRLKGIHDCFEQREERLPLGKLRLPDKVTDIGTKHSKPARFSAF